MKCSSCQSNVPVTAKFCPECATPILKEEDFKAGQEVTLDWLKSVFSAHGYSIEPSENNPTSFIAKQESMLNLVVGLVQDPRLITIQSFWNIKKPGWGQKSDLLNALNLANSQNWLCSFFITKEMDCLVASGAMQICEKISSGDIAQYAATFSRGAISAIDNANLKQFG
jgi:hypothetical protein